MWASFIPAGESGQCFGVAIHRPGNPGSIGLPLESRGKVSEERGGGKRDHQIHWGNLFQVSLGIPVKGEVVGGSSSDRPPTKTGCSEAMHEDVGRDRVIGLTAFSGIAPTAADYVDFMAFLREELCQITKDLSGCCSIRQVVLVEEQNLHNN